MQIISLRRLLLACALAAAAALALAVLGLPGRAGADLSGRIATNQSHADALRAAIAAETRTIQATTRGLMAAQARLSSLQAGVARRQAQLAAVEADLVRARNRLTYLENRLAAATRALRSNLVAAYENPAPDLISVVLSVHSFSDLLDVGAFVRRVATRNAHIMAAARTARVEVRRQATALAAMQQRYRGLLVALQAQRDQELALATALEIRRAAHLAGRAGRVAELRRVNGRLSALRDALARAQSAAVAPVAPGAIRTDPGGLAQAPPGAPDAVARVIAAGNAIAGLPYLYGGGHASFQANAYDCSGSVSYALAAAGLVGTPMTSGQFMSWGDPGPGQWITVYANGGHAWMTVAGWRFDTGALGAGTRWSREGRSTAGFVARHPPGL